MDELERSALSERRLRGLSELWRSQHANDIEVAAARRRFALGPHRAELPLGLRMLGAASVIVLLAGVATAGAGISRWVEGRRAAAVAPAAPARVEAKQRRLQPSSQALQPSPDLPSPPGSATATFAPPPVVGNANRKPASVQPASPQPEAAAVRGAWARLAADLRDGKREEARAAIEELGRSADPATRDAALLVRAQLDLAAGRREQAATTLAELAERGATEVIRKRARTLLEP
ncbi:MAG TPA: hypothetical protein VGK73_29015 [Polyangiaceae bacterium]